MSGACLSHVQISVTLGTVARQAPLSIGILQARTLEWVAISSPRDLPDPGIELASSLASALAGGFFTFEQPVKPSCLRLVHIKEISLSFAIVLFFLIFLCLLVFLSKL